MHAMLAVPYIANACYPRAMQTRVVPLDLEGPGARSSLIRPFCITILYHNLLLFIDIFHI
jgi:hypothetical protein